MTTILRTQDPLEILNMSQTAGRRRSKRLATYDEEDGDFVFTRGSKRLKAQSSEPEIAPVVAAKRNRKPKEPPDEGCLDNTHNTLRKLKDGMPGFPTPNSANKLVVTPKRRKTERSSTRKASNVEKVMDVGEVRIADKLPNLSTSRAHTGLKNKSTIIPLPMSDTPVINRNKEFRKKARDSNRRSSLGLRGRRASSLIDNGHSATPHKEVEISDFYKHIEAEGLSEPRRLKQLLVWTGERCMGPRPSHGDPDSAAELAARHVKESLLNDFANKSEFSDWFNREEAIPTKIVKKPNPRNLELESNIIAVEARLKLLREERDKWKALAKPVPRLPPLIPPDSIKLDSSLIDVSLLDPEQASILAQASSSSASDLRDQVSRKLKDFQSKLEFQVDQFVDGVYKLERYQETINRAADCILYLSAKRLEKNYIRQKEKVGTRDLPIKEVLRSLSRILPERNSGR